MTRQAVALLNRHQFRDSRLELFMPIGPVEGDVDKGRDRAGCRGGHQAREMPDHPTINQPLNAGRHRRRGESDFTGEIDPAGPAVASQSAEERQIGGVDIDNLDIVTITK